jgi:drug/metabolite transporter (DMT)-like permease
VPFENSPMPSVTLEKPNLEEPNLEHTRLEQKALAPSNDRWLIPLALGALYIVWGSTYLGMRVAVEGFPPFLMNAIRFITTGGLMYAFLRFRGAPNPSRLEVWNAARVGVILITGGNVLVSLAEFMGVATGLSAIAVATVTIWATIWSAVWGVRPRKLELAGLGVGLVGVLLLSFEGNFQGAPLGALIIFCAPMLWAFGSIWSRRLTMPDPMMASAIQMLAGGVWALGMSVVFGERMTHAPSLNSVLAVVYLMIFGSLIGFNAYIYLLSKVRPSLATSYAYVNPFVALTLGTLILHEHFSWNAFAALPLILSGVGFVVYAQNVRQRTPS